MPQVRLVTCFLALQFYAHQYCHGQSNNENILFYNFRNELIIELEDHGGRVVWDDETKEAYYLLMSDVSIETLKKYTNDSIPAIRAEVFVCLAKKKADEKIMIELFHSHANDTAQFLLSPTDVVIAWTVRDYMQFVLNHKSAFQSDTIDYKARIAQIRNNPRVVIPGAHHGIINRDSLLSVEQIGFSVNGIKIVSFKLAVRKKEMSSANNTLTKQMKRNISRLKPEENIYFDDLIAESEGGTLRSLGPIRLKIK